MIRTIIVEDELHSRQLLFQLLDEFCPNIQVLGYGSSLESSFQIIQKTKPDLVFLDIELEDGQSFDLLKKIGQIDFKIVFTTAYKQYALKGFEFEAVDYILKPYNPKSIIKAVQRVQNVLKNGNSNNNLDRIKQSLYVQNQKLQIRTQDGLNIIDISKINYCEASQSYCHIYTNNGEKITASKPLSEIERKLSSYRFFRSHQSYLVNMNHVKKVSNHDGGYVVLIDGTQLPLSRRLKLDFINQL